jgi:hypothetical protein
MRTDRDYRASNRWMKVEMLVRVDVIERKSRRAICFKLRLDFRRDLLANRRARKYIKPETYHVVAKMPSLVDEIR